MDSLERSRLDAKSADARGITLTVALAVPGAGPKRVDVDGRAMQRVDENTFTAQVEPGGHAIDWAARGQPGTDYSIEITAPKSAEWRRQSRADDAGRAAGHHEFTVTAAARRALFFGAEVAESGEPVEVTVDLVVPGAGPKRVDLDLRAMRRTDEDTFSAEAGPGAHEIDWAAQGQPETEYSVKLTVDGKEAFARKSRTDRRGRAAGHHEFTI